MRRCRVMEGRVPAGPAQRPLREVGDPLPSDQDAPRRSGQACEGGLTSSQPASAPLLCCRLNKWPRNLV
jgi:hypothetical protein